MNGKRKGWFKKKGADTVDLLTGLISCWELDETSGANVVDANSLHDGTSVNVTVNQTGKINKAYLFNDVTDYIKVPDSNDFSFTNGSNDLPFSVSTWVNFNDLVGLNSYFVAKGTFSGVQNEYFFNYQQADSAILFRLLHADLGARITTSLANTDSGITTGVWVHLVATYDGSETKEGLNLYYNGSLLTQTRSETGTYTGMTNGTTDLLLGNFRTSSTAYMHGLQDQTAIWKNRELTQTEVTELYNDGNGLAYTEWVGGFDADAQAFITAADITDSTQQTAINTLVVGLKANGLWTKMKAIYPFVVGTANSHKYNLKDPRDLDVAFRLTFNGLWTHGSNGAYSPIGAYADTHLNPSTVFGATQNAHQSFYNKTENASGTIIQGVSKNSSFNRFDMGFDSGYSVPFAALSGQNSSVGTDTSTLGFILSYRTGSTAGKMLRQNVLKVSVTQSWAAHPNETYWLGDRNSESGTHPLNLNPITYAFASIGDTMNDTDATNFYNLVQAFQTTLGRQE